jgi:predicted anti-sigma-YlaC factor YlaD
MNLRSEKQQVTAKMRCSKFRRLVVLAEEAEIRLRWEIALREHGEECPGCRQFAEEMEAVRRLLVVQRAAAAPAGFTREVMARVRESRERAARPRMSRYLRRPARRGALAYGLAMAALVVLLVGATLLLRGGISWGPSGKAGPEAMVVAHSLPSGGEAVPELLQQLALAHREHAADHCFTHCCVPPCPCAKVGVGGLCVHG